MDPSQILDTSVVDLANTATLFGQGAIASAISGNPFYSQDPAAAGYATQTGLAPAAATSGISGLLIIGLIAFLILK